MNALKILSRSEMKQITGGEMCYFYCCTGGPGTCGDQIYHEQLLNVPEEGGSHEDCQTAGVNGGLESECGPGEYLAALYM